MGFSGRKNLFQIILILSILVAGFQQLEGARPLEGEQWLKEGHGLVLESLQRGPVRPSGPNPCTYIPGGGSGTCTLNGMNVAGRVAHAPPPPAFPSYVVDVGVASIGDNKAIREQGHSS